MADFVQTMKDWRRMCKHYSDESMKDGRHACVDMCPLGHNTACGDIETATDRDIEDMAKEVAKWAAEHPEPKYPTWKEWLEEQRVVVHFDSVSEKGTKVKWELTNKSNCHIPADIAQKLGIEPKEG